MPLDKPLNLNFEEDGDIHSFAEENDEVVGLASYEALRSELAQVKARLKVAESENEHLKKVIDRLTVGAYREQKKLNV